MTRNLGARHGAPSLNAALVLLAAITVRGVMSSNGESNCRTAFAARMSSSDQAPVLEPMLRDVVAHGQTVFNREFTRPSLSQSGEF